METTTADVLSAWASYFAAMDWHVFPLSPHGKRPALHGIRTCPGIGQCADEHQGWEQRATTDPDRIRSAWSHAAYNIGIATGPSRLCVLDLDTADHPESIDGATALAELAASRGVAVPDTYTVSTPSGGQHLYFAVPSGVQLRNSSQQLAANVDTRSGGGYVVAPGSVLAAGGYELLDDRDPVELPGWVLQALCDRPAQAKTAPHRMPVQRPDSYGAAALEGECERVRTARPGRHNAVLSRAAWRIGQLTATGALDLNYASEALNQAAQALVTATCDCTPTEVSRVINAGLMKGRTHPRHHQVERAA